jgi:hypothetical protein
MKLTTFFLLFLGLGTQLCLAQSDPKVHAKDIVIKVLIDSLTNALNRIYIFPEKSILMSDHLKRQFKKGAYDKHLTDRKLLAEKISADIQSVHRDGHLRVNYDPAFAERLRAAPQESGMVDKNREVNKAKSENFSFKKLEILDGNIGYLQFSGFIGFIEEAKPTITAAFRFLANTDAIIIDLRRNGGGSPWMVKQIASYLYAERTRLNDIYERRKNETKEFWAEPEIAENMKLSMPLYILTSNNTFSAAEDFTYAMQVNKRAVIVGDTTGGGAHPTGPVDIGQGFVVNIPFARSINHITKTDWEGTGVLPDVAVPADQALVTAHQLALEALLSKAQTPQENKRLAWSLNALKVHDYDESLDISKLQRYVGKYGRFTISSKENQFYLHDDDGSSYGLRPISGNLFLASEWMQVEFLPDDGKASSIRFIGKAGWEDVYTKTK